MKTNTSWYCIGKSTNRRLDSLSSGSSPRGELSRAKDNHMCHILSGKSTSPTNFWRSTSKSSCKPYSSMVAGETSGRGSSIGLTVAFLEGFVGEFIENASMAAAAWK
jgi:hypothetical protein